MTAKGISIHKQDRSVPVDRIQGISDPPYPEGQQKVLSESKGTSKPTNQTGEHD